MIKGIAHVCILADDLEETERFYCRVLGLKKVFEFCKSEALFGYYLDCGNRNYIEVFSGSVENKAPRIKHICLEVESIDALSKQLTNHHIAVTEKKVGCDGTWQVWCKDPNGIDIEFHQYTENSSQLTGKDCQVTW